VAAFYISYSVVDDQRRK